MQCANCKKKIVSSTPPGTKHFFGAKTSNGLVRACSERCAVAILTNKKMRCANCQKEIAEPVNVRIGGRLLMACSDECASLMLFMRVAQFDDSSAAAYHELPQQLQERVLLLERGLAESCNGN